LKSIHDLKERQNIYCFGEQEWAIQTGRYREGIDEEDYPTWKTRLRCAFNKAPDIEEVRDRRHLDGPEPYRVYRFRQAPNAATSGKIFIV
jgi:hypothetical protein